MSDDGRGMTGAGPAPSRLFTIPAGVPFLDALARGLLEDGADATVLLPNRRACRALADAMLRASPGGALLLPSIVPIGDIGLDEEFEPEDLSAAAPLDLPPAISRRCLARSRRCLARGSSAR